MATEPDLTVPRVIPPFVREPFTPVLFASPPVSITEEQGRAIQEILALSSSDSRFAQKAFAAIKLVLSGGSLTTIPVILSVEPASKVTGSPSFKLKAKGTGFDPTCTIYINGNAVLTAYVSATELNTDISLVGVAPTVWPVTVRNTLGVVSNSKTFTVTAS
jgi:hypothetical protein